MPRKDRVKLLTERCVQLATLLSAVKARVGEENCRRINALLAAAEEDVAEIRTASAPSLTDTEIDETGVFDDDTPSQLGDCLDTSSLDLLNEDLLGNERSQTTGFVGMSSEVQWFRTILSQLDMVENMSFGELSIASQQARRNSYGLDMGSIDKVSSFTYYLDGESADLDYIVDPHELPTPETARLLLDCYITTVHSAFPILPTRALHEFRRYFTQTGKGHPFRLSPKWQVILNLILAIGAKYSHLIKAEWRGDERDHINYQARAKAYGLHEFGLTNYPDIPQIQITGLLSLYYLSVGQISRAWTVMGTALRFAFALGLHIRNEDPTASPTKKELLVRIWWSLYSLERLLTILTGRPSIIVDSTCSVPLPIAVPEELLTNDVNQMDMLRSEAATTPASSPITNRSFSNTTPPTMPRTSRDTAHSGTFFQATVQLRIITQNVLSSLYSAGTMIRPLELIHQDIFQLGQSLDQWLESLPPEFNFRTPSTQAHQRERTILGMYYRSAKILLTRPCIGGLGHGSTDQIFLAPFARRAAGVCIETANSALDCIDIQPNSRGLYEYGPWWCVVHHLMQALSVFLLGLVFMDPTPHDIQVLGPYIRKAISLLYTMEDPVASKAYLIALAAVDAIAVSLSMDLSSLKPLPEATPILSKEDPLLYSTDFVGTGETYLSLSALEGVAFSNHMVDPLETLHFP